MRVWAKTLPALVVLLCNASHADAQDAVSGQVIVGFSARTTPQEARSIVERAGGAVKRRLDAVDAAAVRPRRGRTTADLRAALRRVRAIRYVEPDFVLRASRSPDDPLYFREYALAPEAVGAIAAPQAWDARTSCSKVATLDSGVQYSHPDLAGNIWHNPHEIKDNGKDDDHNGYVDDYYGVDVRKGSGSGGDDDASGDDDSSGRRDDDPYRSRRAARRGGHEDDDERDDSDTSYDDRDRRGDDESGDDDGHSGDYERESSSGHESEDRRESVDDDDSSTPVPAGGDAPAVMSPQPSAEDDASHDSGSPTPDEASGWSDSDSSGD